jgi:hypothetical protein
MLKMNCHIFQQYSKILVCSLFLLSLFFVLLATDYWILLLSSSIFLTIATWGLNIVSGMAGQIIISPWIFCSGWHLYCSSTWRSSQQNSKQNNWGYELDMIIWLPACGDCSSRRWA